MSVRRWLPWIFGAAIAATVVFVALRFSEARDFGRLAERADGWWLIAATALQAATYVAQGLSGTVVLVGLVEKRGMQRPLVAAAVVIDLVSCHAAYVFGLLVALVVTVAHGEASPVIVIACAAFSAVASALAVVALAIAGRAPGPIARFRPIAKALGFLQEADGPLTRTPRVVIEAALWRSVRSAARRRVRSHRRARARAGLAVGHVDRLRGHDGLLRAQRRAPDDRDFPARARRRRLRAHAEQPGALPRGADDGMRTGHPTSAVAASCYRRPMSMWSSLTPSAKASAARDRSFWLWRAVTCARMRAAPSGTTGWQKPMAKTPRR